MVKDFLTSAFLIFTTPLLATSGISLGEPRYVGSGCPRGTASAALSPDYSALSILFDQYYAEAGGASPKRIDRKNCNVTVPVNVPAGKSVMLFTIDYRGFNSIPDGAFATFSADYFFAGVQSERFHRKWANRHEDQYQERQSIPASKKVWSKCGRNVDLHINTNILAQTNKDREEVYTAVDTMDIQAGLVYYLKWRDC